MVVRRCSIPPNHLETPPPIHWRRPLSTVNSATFTAKNFVHHRAPHQSPPLPANSASRLRYFSIASSPRVAPALSPSCQAQRQSSPASESDNWNIGLIMNIASPVASEVESVEFTFLSPKEIKAISVKRIENESTFDNLLNPVPGGLYDPALGSWGDSPCVFCDSQDS